MADRAPQVLVKIPAKGRKVARALPKHLRYLSREGQEILHDQDGRQFTDMEGLKDLYWAWKHTGPGLSEASDRTEAFHIIFSMPEGTGEREVFGAVRATAQEEFSGHQWLMVQHHDEPQVHVHVCVRTESFEGRRLNPRRADLQRWRERFAYELRERGVEAEATRRSCRLEPGRDNKPWPLAQAEARQRARGEETPNYRAGAGVTSESADWRIAFSMLLSALRRSSADNDRQLAEKLQGFLRDGFAKPRRGIDRSDRAIARSRAGAWMNAPTQR